MWGKMCLKWFLGDDILPQKTGGNLRLIGFQKENFTCASNLAQKENGCGQKKKRKAKQSKASKEASNNGGAKATAIKPSTGGGGGGDICSKPDTSTTLVPN